MFSVNLFDGFTGRAQALREIIRYDMPQRTPMFYRTNLFLHSKRVHLLVKDVLEQFESPDFDSKKALTLALVHDDAEIITGDVQLYIKERMTPEQLKGVELAEMQAIEVLADRWPKNVNGFNYKDLLLHALHKDCPEAQVVSYCDKIDAYCEALHEVFAGNLNFIEPATNYVKRIGELPVKFPFLKTAIPSSHPLLSLPSDFDIETAVKNGTFHNIETIKKISGIPHYDRWKEITISYLGNGALIDLKEHE